ncbi:Nucleosome-binding factor SPN, POB3 subunit [Spironucleus salmonicida]|uniref:Nucleosome-binding factor SPN, POB3 subunit n=1 Tax=Spironucleus salmonicida TaxID=348837 RepID=V6LPC1_9EUKA|nr:Nucleosome-binding factor SPN, POB3 subunit [Spironucleus salmonicida]|eukprot:EST46088.1 hypothetical protein SS50377_14079 [Spironucleus salmonicida]
MQLDCKLIDFSSFPVQGKLSIDIDNIIFRPNINDNQAAEVSLHRSDLRAITVADIGFRSEKGPYIEYTFYMKDVQQLYSFCEILKSQQDQITQYINEHYLITPQERDIDVAGWNWGTVKVSQHSLTLQPVLEEDEEDIDSFNEEKNEPSQTTNTKIEDDIDDIEDIEVFHVPISQIAEFQRLDKRDLMVELIPSNVQQAVYVKSLTFLLKDEFTRNNIYNQLSQFSVNTTSSRILFLEGIQITQPAGKYLIEFQSNQFKLLSSKEFLRTSRDVTRLYLLEKPSKDYQKQFFLIIQLSSGKRIDGHDFLALEVSDRRESREVHLGELQDKLVPHLQIPGFSTFLNAPSSMYGVDSLLEEAGSARRANAVQLRRVPQFIIALKMFQFICDRATTIFSDQAKTSFYLQQNISTNDCLSLEDENNELTCAVTCRYKQKSQRDMYAYFLSKAIMLLPQDIQLINYNEILTITIEADTKNSHGNTKFARMIFKIRGGSESIELSKVETEKVEIIISFIRRKNIANLKIYNQYREDGGRVVGQKELDNDQDDEEDSDFNETKSDDSAAHYEYSSEGGDSGDEDNQKTVKEVGQVKQKPEKKVSKDAFMLQIDEIDNVKPEDALEDIGRPMEWAGKINTNQNDGSDYGSAEEPSD